MEETINKDNLDEDKVVDAKMKFDAFMGNVKDGGLRSVSSIMLLISYIVANMNGKVSSDTIISAIDETMIANYFEVSDAISKLIKSGAIFENDDKMLCVKDNDVTSIELIEKDLPFTIRESSIKACQKIIARESYKRENKASIEKTDNGYTVHLTISDGDNEFLKLDLYASSEEQAQMILDKFLLNPISIYENLIESIFSN